MRERRAADSAVRGGDKLPAKHKTCLRGRIRYKAIAILCEVFQPRDPVDTLRDHESGHGASGNLCHEADDFSFIFVLFPILEDALDDRSLEALRADDLEVLIRGEVDEGVVLMARQRGVQCVCHTLAPELVEILAASSEEPRAHLEPVRLHEVQWAQDPIQARQDGDMFLGPIELACAQVARVETAIDIAVESERRRERVRFGEWQLERAVPVVIELGKILREVHQFADLGLGEPPRSLHQRLCLRHKGGLRRPELDRGGR